MNSTNDYCLIGSSTDVGRVRKANEDSMDCFDSSNGRVVVVCDGMGGHVGGQVASQTAIKAIREFLTANRFDDIKDAMTNAIVSANQAILNVAAERPELNGMGSTCVLLIVNNGKVYYAHVGDSRIYFVANHRISQITKDQSFVQMLVDAGHITKEEAEHHPRKNEITNALGFTEMTPPVLCVNPITPEAGNCFVLCSDGLSGMVPDNRIEHVVSKHEVSIQQRADNLVALANEAGGVDNITVQLVEFAVGSSDISTVSTSSTQPSPSDKKKTLILGIAIAVVVIACGFFFFMKGKTEKNNKETVSVVKTLIKSGNKSGNKSDNKSVGFNTIRLSAVSNPKGDLTIVIPNDKIGDKINDFKQTVISPTDNTVTFVKFADNKINTFILYIENLSPQVKDIKIKFESEKKAYLVVIPVEISQTKSVDRPRTGGSILNTDKTPSTHKRQPSKSPKSNPDQDTGNKAVQGTPPVKTVPKQAQPSNPAPGGGTKNKSSLPTQKA